MEDFKAFADQVGRRFTALQAGPELFVTDCTGDELYAQYLAAFPEGTNPRYRERTEHDCSNCRGFLRHFGGVPAIDPGTLDVQTVWDGSVLPFPYDVVAARLREFVATQGVRGLFRVSQPSFSVQKTVMAGERGFLRYDHLHGMARARFVARDGEQAGVHETSVQVLRDGLERLEAGALDTVLELIKAKQLYRGDEHRRKVERFKAVQERYRALTGELQQRFVMVTALDLDASRFKNSVIGTLVEDLSAGVDLEQAVRTFEARVAPQNYQRTSQVISPRMVEDAMKTIKALGLNVSRRMARLEDVSVNNVLWVDTTARPLMKDGLAGILAGAVQVRAPKVTGKNVAEIGVDSFLADVLPGAQSMKLLVEPALSGHFVTLPTAAEEGGRLPFKWDNPFAWSYAGGVTDSITERVKSAGGNVKALLRFSLAWTNTDDLDIHLRYRGAGGRQEQISFRNRTSGLSGLRGGLDVDMNVRGETRLPVENIAFTQLLPGTYAVSVNNFNRRENRDVGFTLQVADAAGLTNYAYPAAVAHKQTVECLTATVDAQGNVTYSASAALSQTSAEVTGEKWGVPFGHLAEVRCVMLSPNHWDGREVGNRHWFFILKEARTDEQPRGLYNEYLRADLAKHRKVFDVIGERTRPVITGEQLSGIGVSSTLRRSVVFEVTAPTGRRTYRVLF